MQTTDEKTTLSREELYKKLWRTPTTKLAKSFGISDVALAKICHKHEIPKPPLGYWAKLRFGKPVARPPLPAPTVSKSEMIEIYRNTSKPEPELSPPAAERVHFENEPANHVVVGSELKEPNQIIVSTQRSLKSAKPDACGRVCAEGKNCLNVVIGEPSIDRAMRILDALLKAMQERGLKFWIEGNEYGGTTYVEVLGEKFDFRMTEHIAKRERPLTAQEKEDHKRWPTVYSNVKFVEYPSGQLSLSWGNERKYDRRQISDRDGRKIEERLNAFIKGLYRGAEKLKNWRRECEEFQKRWAEQQAIRKKEEARRLREEKRRVQFVKAANAWQQSTQLREYLAAVETAVLGRDGHIGPDSKIGRWLAWAHKRADEMNPISRFLEKVKASEDVK